MVAKQLAASGGLLVEEGTTRLCLDPGPGAVVQYAKRKIDLAKLDGIIISHRHLDHCNDVNVMVEGMTEGGFKQRGRLFCPDDALDGDAVVRQYLMGFPEEVVRLAPETNYSVGEIAFRTSPLHIHGTQTYGFTFQAAAHPVGSAALGWITDSAYYEGIAAQHAAPVMIIHVVLMEGRPQLPHLCVADAERIIREAKPRLAILTHFGMTVWRAHPWEVAEAISQRTGIDVKAARNGMSLDV